MNKPTVYAIVNILFQIFAVVSSQMLGLMWPLYVVMGMMVLVILLQILATSVMSAGYITPERKDPRVDRGIGVLAGIAYGVSCYQLYNLDYVFFAAMMSTHVVMIIITNLIRKEKE